MTLYDCLLVDPPEPTEATEPAEEVCGNEADRLPFAALSPTGESYPTQHESTAYYHARQLATITADNWFLLGPDGRRDVVEPRRSEEAWF